MSRSHVPAMPDPNAAVPAVPPLSRATLSAALDALVSGWDAARDARALMRLSDADLAARGQADRETAARAILEARFSARRLR